jgi:hypothetical protein
MEDCDQVLQKDPNNIRALYRKACAFKMAGDHRLYLLILKDLTILQPNNQILLSEYYGSRQEQIPRQMRRLRTNINSCVQTMPLTTIETLPSASNSTVVEQVLLSFEQLEELRTSNGPPLSVELSYQFTTQLQNLKANDIMGQCRLILRVPEKALFKLARSATPKLVETIIRVCQTMIRAEKRYQQEHKLSVSSFSYLQFSFQLLVQLTALPRLDSALLMIDTEHRASLDDSLAYFSSMPLVSNNIQKLDRLRK